LTNTVNYYSCCSKNRPPQEEGDEKGVLGATDDAPRVRETPRQTTYRQHSAPSISQVGCELGVNPSLVESAEGSIVLVSQWTPAGNDVAILIVTDGLELPHAVNKLQVTHMLTLVSLDAINAVIVPAERQLTQGIFTIF